VKQKTQQDPISQHKKKEPKIPRYQRFVHLIRSFRKDGKRRVKAAVIAIIGFVLSPLSWWNDFLVNIPLAYAFAVPFGFLSRAFFLPAMIIGYWITNIVGFILLHRGMVGFFAQKVKPYTKKMFAKDLLISIGYTLLVVVLVHIGWIRFPLDYFQ
jgi:hypothetical protein